MWLQYPLTSLVGLTASLSAASDPSSNTTARTIDVNANPSGILNATAWALIYTYPLKIFGDWAGSVLETHSVNEIYHQRNLASPDDPGVIKPNVDTLYSRVVLDLSHQDVVLTVPNVTDPTLYWNFPVIDLFGNIIAEIGTVRGYKAGKYLIRRTEDVLPNSGIAAPGSPAPQEPSGYEGIVNFPTTYGTMLIRFLVKQNTTEVLDSLHAYQNASSITTINRTQTVSDTIVQQVPRQAPHLTDLAPNGTFLGIDSPLKQLRLAASLIPWNQPEIYSQRYRVASILAQAGLYNGLYHEPSGVNLTEAAVIANATVTADVEAPAHVREEGNDWQLSIPSYQANYGPHYDAAAYVALYGYQMQTVRQTLYPGYGSLGFTSVFTLAPNTSILYTFSGKPQLKETGFWSLTIYGDPSQYLIPNIVDRYEVGDRTYSLQYQDGGYVYGPNATTTDDGPFQVLIQPADLVPPSNWTGNWLPAAANFSQIVRWYVPEDAMTNGSYVYPKLEVIDAIV